MIGKTKKIFEILIDELREQNQNDLADSVHDLEIKYLVKKYGELPELTDDEKNIASKQKVNAVKMYKERNGLCVSDAINVVEIYLDSFVRR